MRPQPMLFNHFRDTIFALTLGFASGITGP
jgi:hypothetical protein